MLSPESFSVTSESVLEDWLESASLLSYCSLRSRGTFEGLLLMNPEWQSFNDVQHRYASIFNPAGIGS
jgi:hypothetical protein